MSATEAQIARVRRMTAEPDAEGTYDDDAIAGYIEAHPVRDAQGREPYERLDDGRLSTTINSLWTETYDLAAAAADVWDEKASALTEETDTSVDGASITRSQAYQHARSEARKYRGRSRPATIRLAPDARPALAAVDPEFPAPEGEA